MTPAKPSTPTSSTSTPTTAGDQDSLLDRQLCFALYAASRAMVREYTPLLGEIGLTYPQFVTMLALWQHPDAGLAVGKLGEAVQMDSGTLTPLLKRLEREGLVSRTRDTVDGRRVHVRLTSAGRALRDRAIVVPRTVGIRLGLTIEEVSALKCQLGRVSAALDSLQTAADGPVPKASGTSPHG